VSRHPGSAWDRARRSWTVRAPSWARCAVMLLAVAALGGCISEQREQEIGDELALQINERTPLVTDPALNRYVNRLGLLIARHSGRPNLHYHFYIVNSDVVNAFAIPGGHVYINRGLIERTRNVSELSAVMAHEIGHVAARHGARMLERRLRTGSVSSIMYKLILGREPTLLDESSLRLGSALWSASHSREAETEADHLAVGYLIQSGIDPEGIVTFLNRLQREEAMTPTRTLAWFATHPMTRERIAITEEEIHKDMPNPPPHLAFDIASYPDFLRRVKALPPPPLLHPVQLP